MIEKTQSYRIWHNYYSTLH